MATTKYVSTKRRLSETLDHLEDAGLFVSLRDEAGLLDRTSRLLDRVFDFEPGQLRGQRHAGENRFYRFDGTELPLDEHPSQLTHRTGQAQSNVITGITSAAAETIWMQITYTPLTQGPEGWSVLAIGSDVTRLATGSFGLLVDRERLGTAIRTQRRALGLAQTKLARAGGITQASLSNYELGKREMPLHVYLKLCEALSVPPLGLLAREDPPA